MLSMCLRLWVGHAKVFHLPGAASGSLPKGQLFALVRSLSRSVSICVTPCIHAKTVQNPKKYPSDQTRPDQTRSDCDYQLALDCAPQVQVLHALCEWRSTECLVVKEVIRKMVGEIVTCCMCNDMCADINCLGCAVGRLDGI